MLHVVFVEFSSRFLLSNLRLFLQRTFLTLLGQSLIEPNLCTSVFQDVVNLNLVSLTPISVVSIYFPNIFAQYCQE